MMKILKSQLFWVIAFLAVIVLCCVIIVFFSKSGGSYAEVYVEGELVKKVLLSEDAEFEIKTDHGINNIELKDGKVRVKSADCKNQVCVESGWSSGPSSPIICAPHKLTVKITDDESSADIAV